MEIASITKVMTCFLILTIADKFCLDIRKERVIVSDRASKMQGTSARLAYSDTSTVYEMLHGLMLPSGNDASIVLGEWGGKVIRRYSALLRKMRPPDSPIKSDKSLNFL
jgi:D-alanyl-D-alanine carboxypeptidase